MTKYKINDSVQVSVPGSNIKAKIIAIIPRESDLDLNDTYKMVFGLKPYQKHIKNVSFDRYIIEGINSKGNLSWYLINDNNIFGRVIK